MARADKTTPASWHEPEIRIAYLTGLMVGARVPEIGPEIEAILAELVDMPAEAVEIRARAMADVLRGG